MYGWFNLVTFATIIYLNCTLSDLKRVINFQFLYLCAYLRFETDICICPSVRTKLWLGEQTSPLNIFVVFCKTK